MKVLCIKIVNPVTQEEVLEHTGVRLLEEYVVISIIVEPTRGAKLRIVTADGTPALFDARMFATTTDQQIPRNWVVRVSEGGVLELSPDAWLEAGFWERYFDHDASAITKLEAEIQQMMGDNDPLD